MIKSKISKIVKNFAKRVFLKLVFKMNKKKFSYVFRYSNFDERKQRKDNK